MMVWLRSLLAWSIGLSLFTLLLIMIIFCAVLFKPERYDPLIKWVCRALLRAMGIRVQVEDHGGRQADATYLFVANHVNVIDPFLFKGFIPHFFRAVELRSHFSWPLYGLAIRLLGNIPLDREQPHKAMSSLNAAAEALQAGQSILIFPEGTRTRTGRLSPFKRGPFLLAQNAGIDIVPLAQIGSFAIQRKGSLLIRPGKIRFIALEPIRYIEFATMNSYEIRDLVWRRMQDFVE